MTRRNSAEPDGAGDQVAEALRVRLVAGEQGWREGERIPSASRIAFEMGVPLGVVRRALTILAEDGWVGPDAGTGRSTVVRRAVGRLPRLLSPDRRTGAVEVLEARRALETEAAKLASVRRSNEDVAEINSALLQRRAAADGENRDAFVAADTRFHAAVMKAAGSGVLARLAESLRSEASSLLVDLHAHQLVSMESSEAHEDLALAIELQDPELAALATRGQFAPLERRLRDVPLP